MVSALETKANEDRRTTVSIRWLRTLLAAVRLVLDIPSSSCPRVPIAPQRCPAPPDLVSSKGLEKKSGLGSFSNSTTPTSRRRAGSAKSSRACSRWVACLALLLEEVAHLTVGARALAAVDLVRRRTLPSRTSETSTQGGRSARDSPNAQTDRLCLQGLAQGNHVR